jgi:hypothetical protein
MPKPTDPYEDNEAAPPRNQDPAEGSRENVNVSEEDGTSNRTDKPALDRESPRPAPGTYHPE